MKLGDKLGNLCLHSAFISANPSLLNMSTLFENTSIYKLANPARESSFQMPVETLHRNAVNNFGFIST